MDAYLLDQALGLLLLLLLHVKEAVLVVVQGAVRRGVDETGKDLCPAGLERHRPCQQVFSLTLSLSALESSGM